MIYVFILLTDQGKYLLKNRQGPSGLDRIDSSSPRGGSPRPRLEAISKCAILTQSNHLDKLILMTCISALAYFMCALIYESMTIPYHYMGKESVPQWCGYFRYTIVYLYGLTQCLYFSSLIYRSHLSFGESAFKYHPIFLWVFESIVLLSFLFGFLSASFRITIDWTTCEYRVPTWLLIWLLGYQFILYIVSSFLFIRPLIKIISMQNELNGTEFKGLVIKDSVIVTTSMVLSLLSIFALMIFETGTFILFAMFTDVSSLMALYSRHDSKYLFFCGCIHNKLSKLNEIIDIFLIKRNRINSSLKKHVFFQ